MERDVELAEAVGIVDRPVHRPDELVELGDAAFADPKRREADVARLDHPPRLEELDERDAVLGEDEVEVRDQLLGLQRRDVGAVALADIHHAHQGERPERFAQHRPADVHHPGEIPLRRQLVARSQLLLLDLHEQPVGDLLGQRAPRDDGEPGLPHQLAGAIVV